MTRESEWTDRELEKMQGLTEFESGVCECGFHRNLTSNLANVFTFGETVCNVCAGADVYRRVQQESDEVTLVRLGEKPPPTATRPSDGRKTHARLMSPDEIEKRRAAAKKRAATTSRRSG